MEAARLAPSACNAQPWSFLVITDEKMLGALRQSIFNDIYSMCHFAKSAPVLVALLAHRTKAVTQLGEFLRGTKFSWMDLGIVGEHFVLQAEEEGLATCWLGWFNERG